MYVCVHIYKIWLYPTWCVCWQKHQSAFLVSLTALRQQSKFSQASNPGQHIFGRVHKHLTISQRSVQTRKQHVLLRSKSAQTSRKKSTTHEKGINEKIHMSRYKKSTCTGWISIQELIVCQHCIFLRKHHLQCPKRASWPCFVTLDQTATGRYEHSSEHVIHCKRRAATQPLGIIIQTTTSRWESTKFRGFSKVLQYKTFSSILMDPEVYNFGKNLADLPIFINPEVNVFFMNPKASAIPYKVLHFTSDALFYVPQISP